MRNWWGINARTLSRDTLEATIVACFGGQVGSHHALNVVRSLTGIIFLSLLLFSYLLIKSNFAHEFRLTKNELLLAISSIVSTDLISK